MNEPPTQRPDLTAPRIAFLIHGGANSIEAIRARGLSRRLPPENVSFLHRSESRLRAAIAWNQALRRNRPDGVYVLNTALPGALLACWRRFRSGTPFILDTGDVVYEMAKRSGITPPWKRPFLRWTELAAQRFAHTIVVRGTRHREYLEGRGHRRVVVIRDGYLSAQADAKAVEALRQKLGLQNRFVVGVMGSLVFSPALGICYGWDLVEALALLEDLPISGLVIGDGDGQRWLEAKAREMRVADRLKFCGRIPYADVQVYLRLMDVALSTQTNNLPGQVRTTGKIPEYMAAARFILASRVGEAALLLPDEMLMDYRGEVDREYPRKLAERIRFLCGKPETLDLRLSLPDVAAKHCSYDVLSEKFNTVILGLTAGPAPDAE